MEKVVGWATKISTPLLTMSYTGGRKGQQTKCGLPLKFLMTSFLEAPGLLLEKVPEPAVLDSPLAWWPIPTVKNTALLLWEQEAAAAASSAIFTSSPMKSTESSNLNFFWMCSGVEEEEEDEEGSSVLGGEGEMVSALSPLSEPFIFLFLGDVMLPLSPLTSADAGLASWVGCGGGLGEDKPVGNMKNGNTISLAASLLIQKLPGFASECWPQYSATGSLYLRHGYKRRLWCPFPGLKEKKRNTNKF